MGNTVDPFALFDKYGADATRWYLLYASPAWSPTKFDEDGLIEDRKQILWNSAERIQLLRAVFQSGRSRSGFDLDVPYAKRPELDQLDHFQV